jgi:hypothetical protein
MKMISQEEKSKRVLQAEERLLQAKAELAKAKREERKALEKARSHHKYMMGGVIAKHFPECFEFDELEMNVNLAYALQTRDCRSFIELVRKERAGSQQENAEKESD